MAMKLYRHQLDALELAKCGNIALFHDCGTGKTLTALHIITHFKAMGQGPALVVCPLSIIEAAWIEDCKRFTPELTIVSLWHKPSTHKRKNQLRTLAEDHDIYVANYETFKSLYPHICAKGFGVVFVDESSKMKNPKSQITQALLSLAGIKCRSSKYKTDEIIPCRYPLSGTPAPNKQSEYWAQVKFVTGPGYKCFNDNFYAFRNRYFHAIPLGMTGQKMFKFRESMLTEFMNAMNPVTHIVCKSDVLDLPLQVHQIRKIYLSSSERKAYDTLKRDMILRHGNDTVLAQTALTEIMKLRQLTSGFAYGEDGATVQVGKSKLTELKALLDEIGNNQVIIWANFKAEIALLFKELVDCDALWSGSHDRNKTIRDFQNGNTQYLIANPQSAAHGLTFTNCNYAIYYSLNYSYELQKQSQDRIHRIGQDNKCTYYYFIADNTIDEIVYKAVQQKSDLSRTVLSYLRTGTYATERRLQTA